MRQRAKVNNWRGAVHNCIGINYRSPALAITGAPSGGHGQKSRAANHPQSSRRTVLLELGLGGKFKAKSSGWDENRTLRQEKMLFDVPRVMFASRRWSRTFTD